ncbi:MAG: LPS-assembly protein LptD [Magnetococcales bacterium]|nr:LPS-assembly protein LptD [Magnetococcales bacterium]
MISTEPFFRRAEPHNASRPVGGTLSALCIVLALSIPTSALTQESPIDVDADSLEIDKTTQDMVASGHVVVQQEGVFRLEADEARYQGEENLISAKGAIKLTRGGDQFLSQKIHLNLATRQGIMEDVTINMAGPGGHGGAKKVALTSEKKLEMTDGWYTNCDCEKPPWRVGARKIIVDQDANSVEARDMKLYFGDTPVAYFPWWRQPLKQERKSGFLRPEIGASGGNGMEFEAPYYWNMAPNRDMTVALRGISRRGVMGKAEFRYLGLGYEGTLSTNQIYDTQEHSYRGLSTFTHNQRAGGWNLSAAGEYSQTRDFINDFKQDLVDPNSRRLESHVTLDRQWFNDEGYTDVQTGLLWYQDLEKTTDDFTVQRLPYLSLSDNRPLSKVADGRRWRLQSDARIDSFYQLSGDASQRLDLAPTLRYDTPLSVGHFSAQLGVRETAYLIQGDPNQAGLDQDGLEHREASFASFRLDTKLEKQVMGNRQHTIEPTIELVANATSDQGKLPNYDSTLRNFSTSNLFTSDQYSGVDRISNGQWISYGITSRLISLTSDSSIMETATFKIGQRWAPSGHQEYQNDHAFSDIVSSLDLNFVGGWSLHASNRTNPHEGEIARTDASIKYTRANNDKIALGYHFNQPSTLALAEDGSDRLEDLTLRSIVHLSDHWIYAQEADYSLEDQQIKSWETRLEYEESCWSLGIKFGRKLSADASDHDGEYYGLIFSLKGLAGYGK